MKRIKFFTILLLFICAFSSAALAKPPMVEFFFVRYDGVEGLNVPRRRSKPLDSS